MERTDDGLVGRLLRLGMGSVSSTISCPLLACLSSGLKPCCSWRRTISSIVFLLRDRREWWRPVGRGGRPTPVRPFRRERWGRAPSRRGCWRGSVRAGGSWRARVRRAARPWPVEDARPARAGALLAVLPTRGLPRPGREGASGRCSRADRRAFRAHGHREASSASCTTSRIRTRLGSLSARWSVAPCSAAAWLVVFVTIRSSRRRAY